MDRRIAIRLRVSVMMALFGMASATSVVRAQAEELVNARAQVSNITKVEIKQAVAVGGQQQDGVSVAGIDLARAGRDEYSISNAMPGMGRAPNPAERAILVQVRNDLTQLRARADLPLDQWEAVQRQNKARVAAAAKRISDAIDMANFRPEAKRVAAPLETWLRTATLSDQQGAAQPPGTFEQASAGAMQRLLITPVPEPEFFRREMQFASSVTSQTRDAGEPGVVPGTVAFAFDFDPVDVEWESAGSASLTIDLTEVILQAFTSAPDPSATRATAISILHARDLLTELDLFELTFAMSSQDGLTPQVFVDLDNVSGDILDSTGNTTLEAVRGELAQRFHLFDLDEMLAGFSEPYWITVTVPVDPDELVSVLAFDQFGVALAVPEPGSLALLAYGGLILIRRQRSRLRASRPGFASDKAV